MEINFIDIFRIIDEGHKSDEYTVGSPGYQNGGVLTSSAGGPNLCTVLLHDLTGVNLSKSFLYK